MNIAYTKEDLVNFELEIADCFNNKMIRAPIHLSDGNEEPLIEIFKEIEENDWVFSTWRSHYHCLLKGVPKEDIKQAILDGRSITLCFEKQNLFSSAIVGGSIPLAVGTALDLKRKNTQQKVWCFVGDMGSNMGAFSEALKYSINHDLPIIFVIENNSKSVCTDTYSCWGTDKFEYEQEEYNKVYTINKHLKYYKYKFDKWKHAGTNVRVQF